MSDLLKRDIELAHASRVSVCPAVAARPPLAYLAFVDVPHPDRFPTQTTGHELVFLVPLISWILRENHPTGARWRTRKENAGERMCARERLEQAGRGVPSD